MFSDDSVKKLIGLLRERGSDLYWTDVSRLAKAHYLEDPSGTEEALMRALKRWWCQRYGRPLKDPLLESYTAPELVYEYLVIGFYPQNDPKIDEQQKKEIEWAQAEAIRMAKQLAEQEAAKKAAATPATELQEPPKDLPPDIKTTFGSGPKGPAVE